MSNAIQQEQIPKAVKLVGGHPELTYKQSMAQWWKKPLQYYENAVLSLLPFYPKADETRRLEIIDTKVNNNGDYIHEFYIENTRAKTNDKHLVIVHGYGASLGFFYRNFNSLSRITGIKIHAIDMLGFGLSSRPDFPKFKSDTEEDVKKSEDFFVDSMEEWRKSRGIDKFVLVGHSLGGYLSSCYTLKYGKDHVEKLILISPVGVPSSEYSLYLKPLSQHIASKPEPQEYPDKPPSSEIANEYYNEPQLSPQATSDSSAQRDIDAATLLRTRSFPRWAVKLWERNVSPFTFIRRSGPIGPKIMSRWSFTRFGATSYDEMIDLHMYVYKTFITKGSGEYALTRILAPGALARLPLIDRIPGKLHGIPTLWMYGDRDWMSKEAGYDMVDKINKLEAKPNSEFNIVEDAGHHIYLDNPKAFEKAVLDFIGW